MAVCDRDECRRAAEEQDRLAQENAQYRENLGDIVTFGTTAESLDAKLREVIVERDALHVRLAQIEELARKYEQKPTSARELAVSRETLGMLLEAILHPQGDTP